MSASRIDWRSLILGSLTLVLFVLACAVASIRIGSPLDLLAVLALSVPACAACALVFKGRTQR